MDPCHHGNTSWTRAIWGQLLHCTLVRSDIAKKKKRILSTGHSHILYEHEQTLQRKKRYKTTGISKNVAVVTPYIGSAFC